jgi:hypothetical protein
MVGLIERVQIFLLASLFARLIWISYLHGMVHRQGVGRGVDLHMWEIAAYIEQTVVDSRRGVVVQLVGLYADNPSP